MVSDAIRFIYFFFQEENIDLEELEQFAKSFKRRRIELGMYTQGSHMLEKYMNIQDCLAMSLKIKFTLKSTGKTHKILEKSLNFTIYRSIKHCLWRPKSI